MKLRANGQWLLHAGVSSRASPKTSIPRIFWSETERRWRYHKCAALFGRKGRRLTRLRDGGSVRLNYLAAMHCVKLNRRKSS